MYRVTILDLVKLKKVRGKIDASMTSNINHNKTTASTGTSSLILSLSSHISHISQTPNQANTMKRVLCHPSYQRVLHTRVPSFRTKSTSTTKTTSTAKTYDTTKKDTDKKPVPAHKKTSAELDQELRERLESMSGDGGGAGVEYENGRSEGLKRGVKSNMFRVI